MKLLRSGPVRGFLVVLAGVVALAAESQAAAPSGLEWRVERDDAGRVVRTVDPGGATTNIRYTLDARQRIQRTTRELPDGSAVGFDYDSAGRLATMTDAIGPVRYEYDDKGRLAAVHREGAPGVTFRYDSLDRRTEVRVGDFYRVGYSYDFLGRLTRIDTPAGPVDYDYETGQGMVVRSLPNGVKTLWKRQPNGELEKITHGFFAKPDDSRYRVLASYTYTHSPDGRIAAIRERNQQEEVLRQFSYDSMGRLTAATGPAETAYRYEYDLFGNRTRAAATGHPDQVSTYDWAGRLTSLDGKPCRYDADGNLVEATIDNELRRFRYHPGGRLAEAQRGGESVQYQYDGFGRLLVRKSSEGETRFVPDPISPYWQPLVIDEPDGSRTLVVWDGAVPLAVVRGKDVEWLLHDHLGSIRLAVSGEGAPTRRLEYSPFGEPQQEMPQQTPDIGFGGLFWDHQAAAYLTLARVFIPELSGFGQPDPRKRIPQKAQSDLGLWSYSGGDPINFVDRDGNAAEFVGDWPGALQRLFTESMSAIDSFSHDLYETTRAVHRVLLVHPDASEIPQRFDASGDTRRWLVSTLNAYETDAARGLFEGVSLTSLTWEQRTTVRKSAVDRFTHDYSAYACIKAVDSAHASEFFNHIYNKSVASAVGPTNLDWLTTIADSGNNPIRGRILEDPVERYFFEKTVWNIGGAIPQRSGTKSVPSAAKEMPEYGNWWADRDINAAVALRDLAYNPRYSFDKIFPESQSFRDQRDLSPSPVGGVYLGGAGGSIDGLGSLRGVRVDSNGNLVLIGEGESDIKLPPLRLDDVVTVFRSVYLDGEGPTVTIDPNPENPEKSAMVIVHSEATKDTYVGWVLYQADRIMKNYGQGVDNKTQKDVVTGVPGYSDVVDAIYFGGGDPRAAQKDGLWQRFWIVPASARRFSRPRNELTLFDVPLKVKTQKMKWDKNQLVDDPAGQSSAGAVAFTSWFTRNYDGIAAEQFLLPPPESGISSPVAVFGELRRIALMTAIAEKLREQGVPLPFWMRDYEVHPVPFEHFTPAMEVTRRKQDGNTVRTSRVFGGVELSPESKEVKTFAIAADAANEAPDVQEAVKAGVVLAEHLEEPVVRAISPVTAIPLRVHKIADENGMYRAVPVPGAHTLALGPAVIDATDLVIPVAGGRDLRLERHFHSFFESKGMWGAGWTSDLPRLQRIRVPLDRDGGKTTYTTAYELITPLNSLYARFRKIGPVAELGGATLQIPDGPGPFYGVGDARPDFLKNVATKVVVSKRGWKWHFAEGGTLVAIEDGPQVTVFERGADGRVPRIVALLGGTPAARIDLSYNSEGALSKAIGKRLDSPGTAALEVSYAYDSTGRLIGVTSTDGTLGYDYKGAWVASVRWTDRTANAQPQRLRAFEYNDRGQVVSENRGESVVRRAMAAMPEGVEMTTADSEAGKSVTRYDNRMRPVEASDANGARTVWVYKDQGDVEVTVTNPDGQTETEAQSADGRRRTVHLAGGPNLVADLDDGERLTTLSEDGHVTLTQQWRPDGQLAARGTDQFGLTLEYGEDRLVSSLVLHSPTAGSEAGAWQKTGLDRMGRPVAITDDRGLDVRMAYDDSGALRAAMQYTSEGTMGYQVGRDGAGRIRSVKSTWGDQSYAYGDDGQLQRVEARYEEKTASVELSGGLVRRIAGFDGSATLFDYDDRNISTPLLRGMSQANGLNLSYGYDPEGRLMTVEAGKGRRIRLAYDAKGRPSAYAWEPLGP